MKLTKRCIICDKPLNNKKKVLVCCNCGNINVYSLLKRGYNLSKKKDG